MLKKIFKVYVSMSKHHKGVAYTLKFIYSKAISVKQKFLIKFFTVYKKQHILFAFYDRFVDLSRYCHGYIFLWHFKIH